MRATITLRTGILIGNGLVLALVVILATLLLQRLNALATASAQISTSVSQEVTVGANLAAQVANTQLAVDRYLRQPQPELFQIALSAFDSLNDAINSSKPLLIAAQQQENLSNLSGEMYAYEGGFQSLSALLQDQERLVTQFDTEIDAMRADLNDLLIAEFGAISAERGEYLIETLTEVEEAHFWMTHLLSEQSLEAGEAAQEALGLASFHFQEYIQQAPLAEQAMLTDMQTRLDETLATSQKLYKNVQQALTYYDGLVNTTGVAIRADVDRIVQDSLQSLSDSSARTRVEVAQAQQITMVGLISAMIIAVVFGTRFAQSLSHPLRDLLTAITKINANDLSATIQARGVAEFRQLADGFNQMTATLRTQRDQVQQQQTTMERRQEELTKTLDELQSATRERETLASTVRELSVPVISVAQDVIVVPLVGLLDMERANTLRQRLLDGVSQYRARIAILDVTGVPIVDTLLAQQLLRITSSVRLLGAECVVVGIRPDVAEALIASGVELNNLRTKADLRSAVADALNPYNQRKPLLR